MIEVVQAFKESVGSDLSFDDFMSLQGEVFRETQNRNTLKVTFSGTHYFIKQHFGIGWKEIFKELLSFKIPIISALNEKRAIDALTKYGIKTMRTVAYGEKGGNPATKRSFIVTEALENTISLETVWMHHQALLKNLPLKRTIIAELARISRTLHQHGINHRDYYLCHFLMDRRVLKKTEAYNGLYVIDLHRAQLRAKVPLRWKVKDLAGLFFSAYDTGCTSRDYLRFIHHYTQLPLRDVLKEQGNFWRSIQLKADRLYEKHKVGEV